MTTSDLITAEGFDGTEEDAVWWLAMLPIILRQWREMDGPRVIHIVKIPIFRNYHITVAKVAGWALFLLDVFGVNEPTEETLS